MKSLLKVTIVATTLALLAAACGDDSDVATSETTTTAPAESTTTAGDIGEPGPTTTEPPILTASWKGVTEDTVTIAISILDFDALIDMGLQEFGWGDQRQMWEFYIEDLNARGGVAGRQVEAVLDFYNPAFAIEAEEACLRMTEDNDVFAVLGAFVGPAQSATPCLTDQEDLVTIGGVMTFDLLEGAKGVWVSSGSAARRNIPIFFDLLDQTGRIDERSIAIVSGQEDAFTTENAILPILAEHGSSVVVDTVNTISTDDVLAEDAFWQTTAEKIKTEGAEILIINGDTTGAIRGIRDNDLDVEVWVVQSTQLTNLGSTVDKADADGALALGSASPGEAWEEPLMVECVGRFREAFPDVEILGPLEVGELDDKPYIQLQSTCRQLVTMELVFNAAGPELTPASVQAAYEGLGDVQIPGFFFSSWGPGKPDANDGFRLSEWDSTASEAGALVPITEMLDSTP